MEVNDLIGHYVNLNKSQNNIVEKSLEGLNSSAVEDFISISDSSVHFVSDVLDITTKTLHKYLKENAKLTRTQSEKILKLIKLYEVGLEVFGNIKAFNEWLDKPSYGLNSLIPRDIITLSTGIDLVQDELMRIAYGDFA